MKNKILALFMVVLFVGSTTSAFASWYCCGIDPCTWVEDGSDDIIM